MSKSTFPNGTTATLSSSDRPPPIWIGDHIALHFLNSVAAPRGTQIEWIKTGQDFLTWMVAAQSLDLSEAKHLLSQFSARDFDQMAIDAIALREWFRGALTRVKVSGVASLSSADIECLNKIMTHDAVYRHIESDAKGKGLRLITKRAWRTPGQVLAPLAIAMADLLCNFDLNLVRNCENPPCTMWFYDRTKGHRRRWCSQAVCGNRAKVAAFRDRQKQKNK